MADLIMAILIAAFLAYLVWNDDFSGKDKGL